MNTNMVKQETEQEQEEKKNPKAQALALFNEMPQEMKDAIDDFVKAAKKGYDISRKIIELAQRLDYSKEQIEVVIKAKMAALGLRPPNLKALLEIKKEGIGAEGEIEEAADESAESDTANLPFISIPLTGPDGVNKNDIINNLKQAKNAVKIFFSRDDNSFVSIEFS